MEAQERVIQIARELSKSEGKSIYEFASLVQIPKWKVAHILNRLKKLGFVKITDEVKFSAGRPRKLYSLTGEGVKFFVAEGGVELHKIHEKE